MRKAVLLVDLDDTLIPDVPAARQAIAGTLRSLGLAHDAGAVDGVICDPPICPVSEPGVHHGRGIGEVVRWCGGAVVRVSAIRVGVNTIITAIRHAHSNSQSASIGRRHGWLSGNCSALG
ncbi:hypothetical protein E6W39_37920 [Kitasatospora acidiphila]|uniref:Uncharacterized protein n=1 Tax=Kitasatospora acidiphila TaxID=2567942 RepID=A0A540WD69_9ACTN|nr:hypothetical protein [Kitasatospora acidiphila]TQF06918.1 hypothetical protein E6W39_37920 [Kitasatospora acidiphila]